MGADQSPASAGNTATGWPRRCYNARAAHAAREEIMAKVLRCRDLGINCPKEIRAQTEDELLKLAADHAEKDHGMPMENIPPSILAMVKAAIRSE